MNESTKLHRLRKRAIALLLKKADKTVPMLIDFQLDTFLRGLFSLSPRPLKDPPYEGWIVDNPPKSAETRVTSQVGIDLIKRWEGLRISAYVCAGGVWTIGYGHTKSCSPGMKITQLEAEVLLQQDLRVYEKAVIRLVKVPLTQNQFDALVSFAFNVGTGAFSKSSLLRKLNRGQYDNAATEFGRWVRAGGKKLEGLVRRRSEEKQLFLKK